MFVWFGDCFVVFGDWLVAFLVWVIDLVRLVWLAAGFGVVFG